MSGFQSFPAASGFQSRAASGFQSFGGAESLGVTIIMNWIDEASPVYSPNGAVGWDIDEQELRDTLAEFVTHSAMGVFNPGGVPADLKPDDREFPLDILNLFEGVDRPPPLQQFIDDFEALLQALADEMEIEEPADVPLRTLMLDIDGSGSMRRSTIEPGVDEFIAWMEEHHPSVRIVERVYSNERWLHQTATSLRLAAEIIEEEA